MKWLLILLMPIAAQASIQEIREVVQKSECAKYKWKNRGQAPVAYLEGIALSYAKAFCNLEDPYVKIISKARALPESVADRKDALSWYNSNFKKIGLSNDETSVDTIRNTYTFLIGLGMRESSGRYCCGRDMSAKFDKPETAESGTFQNSYGSRSSKVQLDLFNKYKTKKDGCFADVYKKNIRCDSGDLKIWGSGVGADWQRLAKDCPGFATEWAAIGIRLNGGTKGEFGPIKRKEVELIPACNQMLKDIAPKIECGNF